MCAYLKSQSIDIGIKRTRRLMRKMDITAIYPKPNLSRLGQAEYIHSYLLRNKTIDHPNQVWSTDISYIPMPKGKLYLFAIMDVYSRFIVGWGLYNTLEAQNAVDVLSLAVERFGAPEIINSDQGCQFTCSLWEDTLKGYGIKISMDGRGRCRDNAWIERFWRTLKREYVYLNLHDKASDMRSGIADYINYYNIARYHSSIKGLPAMAYNGKAFVVA